MRIFIVKNGENIFLSNKKYSFWGEKNVIFHSAATDYSTALTWYITLIVHIFR